MKKWIVGLVLLLSLMLLSACGTNNNAVTAKEKAQPGVSHTYRLGETFAKGDGTKYSFGGKVYASLVFNKELAYYSSSAYSTPLYIVWTSKDDIVELEDGMIRFKIEDVDPTKGTIQIRHLD